MTWWLNDMGYPWSIQGPEFGLYICGLAEVIFFSVNVNNNPTLEVEKKNIVYLIGVTSSIGM